MLGSRVLAGLLSCALLLGASWARADDKKDKDKEPETRSGTVMGLVTAKGENWLEVKADGEEKARRYVPHWVGGLPKDGGGPNKEVLKAIKKVKIDSRIRMRWEFAERPRVVKIEILKQPEAQEGKKERP